ncbi:MAG: murein hydrolase activator EnvC family protein [Flavobacteriales bacterium]
MLRCNKIFLVVLLFSFSLGYAQKDNQSELAKKKSKKEKEMQDLIALEKETKLKKKSTELTLFILNKKISVREQMINAYNQEIRKVARNIEGQQSVVRKLERDLTSLKTQYSRMLQYAYKTRKSTDKLLFILSAGSFNKAYKRWKYIRDLNKFRKKQAELIEAKRAEIKGEVAKLEEIKSGKQTLLASENEEKQKLTGEKSEKEEVYQDLRKQQEDIKKELKKKKKEADELDAAIKEIIKKSMEVAKGSGKTPGAYIATPEEKALSANFAGNQKKLPWPAASGTISQTFGDHKHPVLETVMTHNNGIDMVVPKGSTARAVFKGTVSAVLILPGDKYAVLIKHGEYYTMYSNLDNVSVKKGDEVSTKGEIGVVKTNSEDGKTELHFEIYKGSVVMNPESWLSPR